MQLSPGILTTTGLLLSTTLWLCLATTWAILVMVLYETLTVLLLKTPRKAWPGGKQDWMRARKVLATLVFTPLL